MSGAILLCNRNDLLLCINELINLGILLRMIYADDYLFYRFVEGRGGVSINQVTGKKFTWVRFGTWYAYLTLLTVIGTFISS